MNDGRPIRVVVVDDHAVIREVVRFVCEREGDLDVVGEAGDGEAGFELCRLVRPDVAVIALELPDIDGLDLARKVKEEGLAGGILALTKRDDDEVLLESRRVGVQGYLHKDQGIDEIVGAIRDVAAGRSSFPELHEHRAQQALGGMLRQAREARRVAAQFTPRELEVLRLIAEGLTTRQMSGRLGVSARTVESHISKLYRKLDAKTRVQALTAATRLGLLDPG